MGLSYMKCGKVECEKGRMLGGQFCEEHALTTLLTGLRGLRDVLKRIDVLAGDAETLRDKAIGPEWQRQQGRAEGYRRALSELAALDTLVRTVEGEG